MATVQCIQQANAPRDTGWTDLLAQAPTTSPTLAQTVLAVPPDADTRELRYDGTSGPTPGSKQRKAQRSGADRSSIQPGPSDDPTGLKPSPAATLPPSDRTDSNGQGGMVTRGSKRKVAGPVQPSEQPGADPVVRAPEEATEGGGGVLAASPIGRRGADIMAEVVEGPAMDDAGNLRQPTELVAPSKPTEEATTIAAAGASVRQGQIQSVEAVFDS